MAIRVSFPGSGNPLVTFRSKYPRNPAHLSAPFYQTYRYPSNGACRRWTSNVHSNSPKSELTTPLSYILQIPPSVRYKLRGVELLASINGGRLALDILDNLKNELYYDDFEEFYKGIICLRAYTDSIKPLSIEEAKDIVRTDNAGIRVISWVLKLNIRKLIERNCEETRALLVPTADILVGAGYVEKLMEWVRHKPRLGYSMPQKEIYKQMRWKGELLAEIMVALVKWCPSGSADPAYEFFSEISKEHFEHQRLRLASPYGHVPMGFPIAMANKIMSRRLPASPESFDRCCEWMYRYFPERFRWFREAISLLNHPTNPTANVLFSYLKAIDKGHHNDTQVQKNLVDELKELTKYTSLRVIYTISARASDLLRREDRTGDAEWLVKFLDRTRGYDSSSWNNYQKVLRLVQDKTRRDAEDDSKIDSLSDQEHTLLRILSG
ncbi:hypothetical protein K449DRAFT_397652 [Hypoxylon sp. EC38]|nr:hypothetical protein K449DRAFT_397652 [Hypoxylon sp. EC38]